jgi:hypothetical protein
MVYAGGYPDPGVQEVHLLVCDPRCPRVRLAGGVDPGTIVRIMTAAPLCTFAGPTHIVSSRGATTDQLSIEVHGGTYAIVNGNDMEM